MNCRDFLTEFEERRTLSQAATLHLNDCPDCKKTSNEQTRVWQMIEGMKRVDAPNDFDFRVKARIANGRPAQFQPRLSPALRFVLPLGLIVLILGVVVFNTAYFSGGDSLPAVADNVSPTINAVQSPANISVSPEEIAAINNLSQSFTNEKVFVGSLEQEIKPKIGEIKETKFVASKSTRKLPPKFSRENLKEDGNDGVGSRDSSYKAAPPPLLPTGIPNENSPNSEKLQSADELSLSFIGIETVSEGNARKVKAVTSGSVAERAGVKVGDVIEAIDGRRISSEPAGTQKFEGKKLTVRRGAEKTEIDLQSKSN